jgi:hypothetical protein
MGYFTYRILRDVTGDRLAEKLKAHLNLFEPGTAGRQLKVTFWDGDGCSGFLLDPLWHTDMLLMTIPYQFGGVWMDVRWQDGDWWDLTVYDGANHLVGHSVNPWAHDDPVDLTHNEFRINRVCELWPRQSERIRPYLLPWREPQRRGKKTEWVPRTGKAYPSDEYEYGDADQIHDFAAAFGIGDRESAAVVGAG